ncbi:MAG: hypothetical protein ACREIS_12150 [Nitrospiraceae bacterium]
MSEPMKPALEMIQRQVQELDAVLKQASTDLNAIAGSERVQQWKKRTISLIAQHLGQDDAQRLANKRSELSSYGDPMDELQDEIDMYREFVVAFAEEVKKRGAGPPGAS